MAPSRYRTKARNCWVLLDAKRGEMVVDFCAGAGGKTPGHGRGMRNTGRLYAFDTSAHRLDALKPWLARSGLSNVTRRHCARARRAHQTAGRQDRPGCWWTPLFGPGHAAPQPDLKWRQSPQSGRGTVPNRRPSQAKRGTAAQNHSQLVYATTPAAPGKRGNRRRFHRQTAIHAMVVGEILEGSLKALAHASLAPRRWNRAQLVAGCGPTGITPTVLQRPTRS